jgi:hypothetical protein
MWPVVPTVLACHRRRGTSSAALSALVASGCCVLDSTPPALISAASISCAVSSPEEGYLLVTWIHELAAEHRLVATVTVAGRRLRVRFTRLDRVPETSDGAS